MRIYHKLVWRKLVWRGRPRPRNACSKIIAAGTPPLILALALLAPFAPCALAQRTPNAPATPGPNPHFNVPPGSFARTRHQHPSSRHHQSLPVTSFLSPFFGDSFNPEDFSSPGDPASQPPAFLLQATHALSGSTDYPGQPGNDHESSSQPLLIELQGDRYVRVSGAAIDGEALPLTQPPGNIHGSGAQPSKSTRTHSAKPITQNPTGTSRLMIAAASPVRDLPAAVLIFRDGHSEEVHDYTIADGFLYARGDYYTDGYWNKKIDLSTLDLPRTLQGNAARNVKFILPSSPNEVITRP